jgi:hypothetical protein
LKRVFEGPGGGEGVVGSSWISWKSSGVERDWVRVMKGWGSWVFWLPRKSSFSISTKEKTLH